MKFKLKLTTALMLALQTLGLAEEVKPEVSQECVVLIHGLGRSSLSMKRMEWSLARAGYRAISLDYPSRKLPIQQLSENYLTPLLNAPDLRKFSKIHFVTHSMGGVLLRHYLSCNAMDNLGSVVMLAPPNQGSALVDQLRKNAVGRWVLGPAGCELGTTDHDLPLRLGPAQFSLAVIAGDRSLNPIFSRILGEPNDGKISVESAKLVGMKEFLLAHQSHTWMMWRRKTVTQVLFYFRHDKFSRAHI